MTASNADLNRFDQRDDSDPADNEPDMSEVEQALVHELFDSWNQYAKSNPTSTGSSDDRRNAVLGMDLVIFGLLEIHPLYSGGIRKVDRLADGDTDEVYHGLKSFYVGIEVLAKNWESLKEETQALEIAKKSLRTDAAVIEIVALSPEYR